MNLESKKLTSLVSIAALVILLLSLVMMSRQIVTLKAKVNQLTLIAEEKDKQLETDKVQYTNLAARLHKEIKKAGELEEELKKYRRGK
jgi:predicted Holliday junction resolvase-like endonuclease